MSQDTQQNAGTPQMLDPESAYATVHQRVYAPVFFEKLASQYGIKPQNEADAMEMLTMAAQLRTAHDVELEKQASVGNPVLAGAKAHLQQQLNAHGYNTPHPDTNQQLIKEAAAQASFDPDLARAVLSLQTASEMAAQQAAQQQHA